MKRVPLVVALVALCPPAAARAEVNVGASLEWLTCEADLVVVGRVEKVVSTRGPGQIVYHDCAVEVAETIKGKAEARVVFCLRSYQDATDALPAALLRSKEPTLLFLSVSKEKEKGLTGKFVPTSKAYPLSVFDLAAPGKYAFDSSLKVLSDKKAILTTCRDTATKLADHLKKHPNGRVEVKRIDAGSSAAGEALYAGSATYVKVPVFTTGESK